MLKNIAIIMGGYSSEYQISLKSGSMVYDTLDRYKYTPYAIHIFKNKQKHKIYKNRFTVLVLYTILLYINILLILFLLYIILYSY